ncbi:uncharacterized protein LOC105428285 [Pogonomyrmex barbatus]|uniref:Uncharacterized protein LOC105428285 n=1 Tax=Pogonomyrmex barbatus TaxID=144034 RepID=A0A6I9WA43_9HYME|nr:uncharacterized protein LOC105428285 [Pogonomyrmex barbatus]
MHLYRSAAQKIALILAILAITCEISWASKQCKTVVMDVHMKRCRLGAEDRAKRSLERFDLQKYDEKYEAKRGEGPDYSKVNDSHGVPQKRQLSHVVQVGDIALPIVTEAINGAAKARAYTTSGTGYYDPKPSPVGSILGWPGYYLTAPYPLGRGFVPFLTPDFNDAIDLYLNDEELDELYNDIYKRLSRASKDEAWKVFLETASKCCQNADKCLKETTYVPCLGHQVS